MSDPDATLHQDRSDDLPDSLQGLADALGSSEQAENAVRRPAGGRGRQAAVLALFSVEGGVPRVLLTERSSTMRSHAGQVSFPGGSADPGDEGPAGTALREAFEEVGLHPGGVQLLGELPAVHVSVSGFDVTTVVGWWRDPTPLTALEVAEVASVHCVSVPELVDPANRRIAVHPSGFRGPAFLIGDLFIWGLTAGLLDGLLRLGGWERSWRPEEVPIPERFLRGSRRDREREQQR